MSQLAIRQFLFDATLMMLAFQAMSRVRGVLYSTGVLRRPVVPSVDPAAPVVEQTDVVIGYRAWRIKYRAHGQPFLSSIFREGIWPYGQAMQSRFSLDAPPYAGIHAFKSIEDVHAYIRYPGMASLRFVIGEVSLWGDVIEHERGWVAQYAYPRQLSVIGTRAAQELRRGYGCEVTERAGPPPISVCRVGKSQS